MGSKRTTAFWVYSSGFLITLLPGFSSPMALTFGLVLSLGFQWVLPVGFKNFGKLLLQLSIVAFGLALNPHVVWRAGVHGVGFTAASLVFTFALGFALASRFQIRGKTPLLITVGTAICGGSAISAVGPVIGAKSEEMSVSLAVVFLLNAIALFIFPWIGHLSGMSPTDFGYWSAIAIHDMSSVMGAAMEYHANAVAVAVIVKLTRALWIIPVTLLASYWVQKKIGDSKNETSPPLVYFGLYWGRYSEGIAA